MALLVSRPSTLVPPLPDGYAALTAGNGWSRFGPNPVPYDPPVLTPE